MNDVATSHAINGNVGGYINKWELHHTMVKLHIHIQKYRINIIQQIIW